MPVNLNTEIKSSIAQTAVVEQFADIIRMKSLISQAQALNPILDSALNAGFFDQSHFMRSVKKFTGQTPKSFFAAAAESIDQNVPAIS